MWPSLAFEVTFGKFYCSRVKSISVPTIFVMVKIFNAQYLDQNLGVRLSGAGCGILGIVCIIMIANFPGKVYGRFNWIYP